MLSTNWADITDDDEPVLPMKWKFGSTDSGVDGSDKSATSKPHSWGQVQGAHRSATAC